MSENQVLDYSTRSVAQAVDRITKKFRSTVDNTYATLAQKYRQCMRSVGKVDVCQQKYTYFVPEMNLETTRINECINKAREHKEHPQRQIDKCVREFEKHADTVFARIVQDVERLSKS